MKRYAAGKHADAICDRCGFEYPLHKLKELVVNERATNLRVCPECWEGDHPQNKLGKYIVDDPQALRNPRPDTYEENRKTQWGWNPVGYRDPYNIGYPNSLAMTASVGTVTVTIL